VATAIFKGYLLTVEQIDRKKHGSFFYRTAPQMLKAAAAPEESRGLEEMKARLIAIRVFPLALIATMIVLRIAAGISWCDFM
jgi:hypothetical protein